MIGYVYRFLDKQENIIYVGSCRDLMQRLRQHFEHGHLEDSCYNDVLFVDYAEFKSRTEAYMYEQYEIGTLQPVYNTSGKFDEPIELENFNLIKSPIWKRLYAKSNYGYRYEKVYTNFTEENPHLREPNRCFELEMAEILNRFKTELEENVKILSDINLLRDKCPTYLSLINTEDLELLKQCMVKETMHMSFYDSICNERFSDTDYDSICIDKTILKYIEQLHNREIHEKCGMIEILDHKYEFDFPYTKKSTIAIWIPALCDKSLQEIEKKAIELLNR